MLLEILSSACRGKPPHGLARGQESRAGQLSRPLPVTGESRLTESPHTHSTLSLSHILDTIMFEILLD